MKNKFLFLAIFMLFSCHQENDKMKKNSNEIISLIYGKLAKRIEPVFYSYPKDKIYTKKDSSRIDSLVRLIKEERASRRFIVAIDSLLKPYQDVSLNDIDKNCDDFVEILSKLQKQKDTLKIDISKIENSRNDSIIYFKKELLTEDSKDFFKFDMLLSFSRIAFNEDYTKAVLKVSESQSKLAGSSSIYFLEKVNNEWQIRCKKELSIS